MEATNTLLEHHKIIIDPKQAPCRLDKFLVGRLPAMTRSRIQHRIAKGHIRVNEKEVKPSYKTKPCDVIQVILPHLPLETTVLPEAIPLEVVYEDAHLLVVNKPAGMVVHPGTGNWTGTLVNALVHYCAQLPAAKGNEVRPGLVHRIDKGTSGLLLVAKDEPTLTGLAKQFSTHTIERSYYALVWGRPELEEDIIDLPIEHSRTNKCLMTVCEDGTNGKNAVTHYKVLEQLGYVTFVKCKLNTGRTHQIRVHMHHIGHPLFGDTRYGGNSIVKGQRFAKYAAFVQNCLAILPYQALHAHSLGFVHPITQEKHFFQVPLPFAFLKVLQKWRNYAHYSTTISV